MSRRKDPKDAKATIALMEATRDIIEAVQEIVKRDVDLGLITESQVRFTIEARKKAVIELKAKGLSNRQIAKITGADKRTIGRDLAGANAPNDGANAPPRRLPQPDGDTEEERWRRSVGNIAGEAISMASFWSREFGGAWQEFKVPRELVTLAEQAAEAWNTLARELREKAHAEKV